MVVHGAVNFEFYLLVLMFGVALCRLFVLDCVVGFGNVPLECCF